MDFLSKEFLDYLIGIGIVGKDKSVEVMDIYHTLTQEQKSMNSLNATLLFKDIMISLMKTLFPHFTNEIRLNMINIFLENRKEKQMNKLRVALIIGMRTRKSCLVIYYHKWKRTKGFVYQFKNQRIKNKSSKRTKSNNVIHKTKSPNKLNNKPLVCRLETSWDKREQIELEECTFTPVINTEHLIKSASHGNDNNNTTTTAQTLRHKGMKQKKTIGSVYDRLYYDKDKYDLKKQILAMKIDTLRSFQTPFNPCLYASPKKNINNKSSNYDINSQNQKMTFFERQKSFLDVRCKSIERIKSEIEKSIVKEITFSPKINGFKRNKSYSQSRDNLYKYHFFFSNFNTRSTAHIRLYNDHFLRKEKNQERLNSQSSQSKKRLVDYSNIRQLYERYKTKKLQDNKTRRKVEEEEGLTFSPYLQNRDTIYHRCINTKFFEREQKHIDDKQEFIERNQRNDILKTQASQIGFKNHYTQEEKDEIAKRIIERLYNRQYVKDKHLEFTNPTEAKATFDIDSNFIGNNCATGNAIEITLSIPSENGLTNENNTDNVDKDNNNCKSNMNQVNTVIYNKSLNSDNKKDNQTKEALETYDNKLILIDDHPSSKKKQVVTNDKSDYNNNIITSENYSNRENIIFDE